MAKISISKSAVAGKAKSLVANNERDFRFFVKNNCVQWIHERKSLKNCDLITNFYLLQSASVEIGN